MSVCAIKDHKSNWALSEITKSKRSTAGVRIFPFGIFFFQSSTVFSIVRQDSRTAPPSPLIRSISKRVIAVTGHVSSYPDVAVWSISGHEDRRRQNAVGLRGCEICRNDPVRLGPEHLGPPPLWGVTIRGMPPTLPVLADRLDAAADAIAATASSPAASGPPPVDSLDSENLFGLRFRLATPLVTIWWSDEKKLIVPCAARPPVTRPSCERQHIGSSPGNVHISSPSRLFYAIIYPFFGYKSGPC